MPALPDVPNVLRVQLRHSLSLDLDVLTRIYLSYSGSAPTGTGLSTMAAAVAAAWATDLKPFASSEVELTEVVIVDLSSSTAAVGTSAAAANGTRSGGVLSAGTCVMLNFAVARRYRGGKPRVYLPYFTQTDLTTAQEWLNASRTALLTAWNTWLAAVIAAAPGGTTITGQVNVSYYSGFTNFTGPTGREKARATVRAVVPTPDPIVATSVNQAPSSQRRRNRST